MSKPVRVNRAPVLTLWAALVAEAEGHPPGRALGLGAAIAGTAARAKARRLGLAENGEGGSERHAPAATVHFMGRDVPLDEGQHEATQRYLVRAFGERLEEVKAAMHALIRRVPEEELDRAAFRLYEAFRPEVPEGVRGWGAKGELDLDRIRKAG